jgi:hypothetical protein
MAEFLQLIQLLAMKLVQLIQPILVPLCFVLAWGLLAITAWHIVVATRDGINRAKEMHRIPCSECGYFTDNHLLKCPLHPKAALSEAAIGCTDFEAANPLASRPR